MMASGNDSPGLASTAGTLEVVVSKLRMFAASAAQEPDYPGCRVVVLSAPIANYGDVAEWIGAPKNCVFNFAPTMRPELPLELHIQSSFSHNYREMRVQAMHKPAYGLLKNELKHPTKRGLLFVDDRQHARLSALELVGLAASDGKPELFMGGSEQEMTELLESFGLMSAETTLLHCLRRGVGYLHSAMAGELQQCVLTLFEQGIVRALVVAAELCWALDKVTADLVLLLDPMRFEHTEQRYVTYTTPELFQMLGRAARPGAVAKAYILCHSPKKAYFLKVLSEPILLESPLEHVVADALNAEVAMQNVASTQDAIDWLTWTLVYRRVR